MKDVSKQVKKVIIGLIAIALVSCVTVNVHFPEGAVQKAADDYVKELYRVKEEEKKQTEKSSYYVFPGKSIIVSISFISLANAAPEMKVNTTKAQAILKNQASRLAKIDKYKSMGVLGENSNGMLVVKDPSKLKKLEQKMIDKLVSEENEDRKDLYSEVMNANNIGAGQKSQVISSFSKSFIENSPKGTWVEKDGAWSQK
ncbi:MAG: DUF1318 domain-containing protein [Bdellovibrionales bacterium]|nr:DUF1318 domain-containing protein [Bdellovibrionales bacterium]